MKVMERKCLNVMKVTNNIIKQIVLFIHRYMRERTRYKQCLI